MCRVFPEKVFLPDDWAGREGQDRVEVRRGNDRRRRYPQPAGDVNLLGRGRGGKLMSFFLGGGGVW